MLSSPVPQPELGTVGINIVATLASFFVFEELTKLNLLPPQLQGQDIEKILNITLKAIDSKQLVEFYTKHIDLIDNYINGIIYEGVNYPVIFLRLLFFFTSTIFPKAIYK